MNSIPIDIETAPMRSYHWKPKTRYIPHNMNEEPTTILMAAWRKPGKKIEHISVHDFHKRLTYTSVRDDKGVVKKLHDLLMWCAEENVILVYQNGDRFDLPKINSRVIYHRLKPLPIDQFVTVDTLTNARKMGFDYNRLDFLDRHLHGYDKGKVDTRGWEMWRDVVEYRAKHDDRLKALNEMIVYNEGDIIALERVFETLRPHMLQFPNMNHWTGTVDNCPRCGSGQIIYRSKPKIGKTSRSVPHRRASCKQCGHWFFDKGVMRKKGKDGKPGKPLPKVLVA